jgi:hypothetical protein
MCQWGSCAQKSWKEKHDVPMAGHHGERITKVAVGKRFYWPKMKQDVKHFMHAYVKYQAQNLYTK